MKNNKSRETSSLDLSNIYKSVKALDASIEALLNALSNENTSKLNNKQCNFQQQKQPKDSNNFGKKKRVIKKLNTNLIKQILMETKMHKKEATKRKKDEK